MKLHKVEIALLLFPILLAMFCAMISDSTPQRVAVPEFAELIPDRLENYRSAQPTEAQLVELCRSGRVERIIRMNGNGADSGGVSVQREKNLCREYGVQFHFINMHGNNQPEQKVHELLQLGRTYVHCRHGFDRTGAAVGYHLRQLGWEMPAIVEHNRWRNYIERKGAAYQQYFDKIL